MKSFHLNITKLTCRTAVVHFVHVGIALLLALAGEGGLVRLWAQGVPVPIAAPSVIPPAPDPRFPQVPTWKTELRQLAPNVYAYVQGGGPGIPNRSVSNAGIVIGDDGCW
jgi:hypothetical protein